MNVAFDGRPAAAAYSVAFRRLRDLPGFSQQDILRAEAGSILKTWAGRTKVTKPDQANFRARLRAGKHAFGAGNSSTDKNQYGITVNTGKRDGFPGAVWFRTQGTKRMTAKGAKEGRPFQLAGHINANGTFSPSWLHFRSSDWSRIEQGATAYGKELAALLPLAQKSVGLGRQSVIQIADELGIDLNRVQGGGISGAGIAKARAAIASNGRSYKNGFGSQGTDGTKSFVQLINRLPYGVKTGMDRTLASVLAGRAKYIEQSYQKGAFDSMKKTAAAFPNIFNTSGL